MAFGTRLNSVKKMKEIMGVYYLEAKNAQHNNRKVAWVTSGAPVEFLYAMDVIPIYPENYAAMCGATHMSLDLMKEAEGMGYSTDLCSYARTDIGADKTQGGPIMGLPKPDFLLNATNICNTVTGWYKVVQNNHKCPMYTIDMPFQHREITPQMISYVADQLRDFVPWLEETLDAKFDMMKFYDICLKSFEGSRLWNQVLDFCKRRPAPINSFDSFMLLAPIVTLRGTQQCIDFYQILVEEIEQRTKDGVGAVENEQIRLMWDNLPIWGHVRFLSELLAKHNAAPVVSSYTNAWALADLELKEDAAFELLAQSYLAPLINRSYQFRMDYMSQLVKDYELDGCILHSNRSCKPYSFGMYMFKDAILEATGKPTLILDGDQNDPRVFSEAQVTTRIEAFIESIAESKGLS